jgi:lipopolysaccharide assembly outer membrane protein LptD (OstA)
MKIKEEAMQNRSRLTCKILILLLVVISCSAFAQEESAVETEEQTVYINAESLDYQEDKTLLSGGIEIRRDETIIRSERGELFREEQKMILEENIELEYPDGRVSSDFLTAFLKADEYVFENNVRLDYIVSDENDKLILKSEYLKIFGENSSFTAEKEVVIDYEQQIFKGDNAEYDGSSETLELSGNVEIEEDNDWIRSDKAVFDLSEDGEGYTAEGNVQIRMEL